MQTNVPKRFTLRGILIGVVILILSGLFAVPMFLSSMVIAGVEFCPQLFQKRDFNYLRIPGTKIRLGSTTLSPASSPSGTPVLTHLAATNPAEWQVSKASQGGKTTEHGPEILIGYLTATNADGANAWDDWSFKNPAHAKVLWPIVQEVAEQDLYFCVPELFRLAASEIPPPELGRKLRLACIDAAQLKLQSFAAGQDLPAQRKLKSWGQMVIEEFGDDSEFQSRKAEFAPE